MTTVDIVVPVFNEERDLPGSVAKLVEFLGGISHFDGRIIIADNASTDRTWTIAQDLAKQHPKVRAFHLDQKGRGRALKTVWLQCDADIVSYMDVDLSTDLKFFPLMVSGLSTAYDIAIGSRHLEASRRVRCREREILSLGYNWMVRAMFGIKLADAQCGFKAIRRDVAQRLVPHVQNTNWFFDTELLLLAYRHGYRVFEVPVNWVEDSDSRVRVVSTAIEDIKGLLRVRFTGRNPQIEKHDA